MKTKEQKQERRANITTLIFTAIIGVGLAISIFGCTPSRGAASMIEPSIARLEAEVSNPTLPDSLKSMKLDTLRRLKQSQQIAKLIIGGGKKNSYNISIGGDATATQNSKVKDQHKEKSTVKQTDKSKVKEKPVSKPKNKPVTKVNAGSGSPWWMWPVIVILVALNLFQLLRRFLPGFLKIA